MTPDQVLFIVRAAVQVGSAVDQAWQQKLRDDDLLVPDIDTARANISDLIDELFRTDLKDQVEDGGDLEDFWDPDARGGDGGVKDDAGSRAAMCAAAEGYWARQAGPATELAAQTASGLALLKQWKKGEGPPPAYVRIVVSLATVAADYARVNPGVFRAGGKAEPIIVAIAEQIPKMLPDPDAAAADWNLSNFAEQAATTFLHAGLTVLQQHPERYTGKQHVQALLSSSLTPMLALFKSSDAGTRLDLANLQETLVGPVAKAALGAIAARQADFFGDDVAPSRAAGAIVGSVLGLWQEQGIQDAFSTAGLQKLASRSLDVIAAHPALFLGRTEAAQAALAKDLLSRVAKEISQHVAAGGRGGRELLTEIGVEALGAVGAHAASFVDKSKPWDRVAASALTQVAEGLAAGLKSGGAAALDQVLSRERAIGVARAVLQEAARTPGMLVEGGKEIQQVVAAIAAAMSADDNLLLGQGEWSVIAVVAAEEAAKNPERLFKLDGTKPEEQLGTRLISTVLKAAAADFRKLGRKSGVVAGDVLADAVARTLRAAVGNLQGAAKAVASQVGATDPVALLVLGLNEYARDNRDSFGWREWRWAFRVLVVDAIDEGAAFKITPARIRKLLLEAQPETT